MQDIAFWKEELITEMKEMDRETDVLQVMCSKYRKLRQSHGRGQRDENNVCYWLQISKIHKCIGLICVNVVYSRFSFSMFTSIS